MAPGVYGDVASSTYNLLINDITPPTVLATPPGYPITSPGTFKSAVFPLNVTFTASEPSTIYYTTNGSDPTESSASRSVSSNWGSTSSIPVSAGQTVKFYAEAWQTLLLPCRNGHSAVPRHFRPVAPSIGCRRDYADFRGNRFHAGQPVPLYNDWRRWFFHLGPVFPKSRV